MKISIIQSIKVLTFISVIAIMQSCSTVPLTGRSQISLLPESSMVEMSLTNYSQFLTESKVSDNKAQTEAVKRVGTRIAAAVEEYMKQNGFQDRLSDFKWEFNLVEDETINAWCMPGGKVVFYTGILPMTQDDAGIAVVMGHEIAHAVARHGNERMSQQLLVQMGGIALSEAVKQKPQQTQTIFMAAYGAGSQVGLLLPYSRTHEYEADKLGMMFMAMAGYDPQKAPEFWTRMSQQGESKVPEFLSTHPMSEKRIEALNLLVPEAMKYYKK